MVLDRAQAREHVIQTRRQYLRELGVSAKVIRANRLLEDMPEETWQVLLRSVLRARKHSER